MSATEKIRASIRRRSRGKPFSAKELRKHGSAELVHQVLSRLTKEGHLERVRQGLYVKPKRHHVLGKLTVPTAEVVKALARANEEVIRESGATAANELGLSTQVPARPVFLTSGRSRELKLGNQVIKLRYANRRYLKSGTAAGKVVRCLRYLGKSGLSSSQIEHLRNKLSSAEKRELRSMLTDLPAWMGTIIRKIAD